MWNKKMDFIKSMRIILFVTLGISVIWNILCLSGFLPLKSYTIAYIFILIPCFIIIFRSLFFRNKDIATYIGDANQKEKVQTSILICLTVVWVITLIACLVLRIKS
jgi:hypothetical protein